MSGRGPKLVAAYNKENNTEHKGVSDALQHCTVQLAKAKTRISTLREGGPRGAVSKPIFDARQYSKKDKIKSKEDLQRRKFQLEAQARERQYRQSEDHRAEMNRIKIDEAQARSRTKIPPRETLDFDGNQSGMFYRNVLMGQIIKIFVAQFKKGISYMSSQARQNIGRLKEEYTKQIFPSQRARAWNDNLELITHFTSPNPEYMGFKLQIRKLAEDWSELASVEEKRKFVKKYSSYNNPPNTLNDITSTDSLLHYIVSHDDLLFSVNGPDSSSQSASGSSGSRAVMPPRRSYYDESTFVEPELPPVPDDDDDKMLDEDAGNSVMNVIKVVLQGYSF